VFQQFSAYFTFTTPEHNQQSVRALWQGIQGICLLSAEADIEASALLLLRTFLHGWNNYSV
jgi:hypothetical protein